ncbi:transcription factor bHLH57-like isoform X2 [Mangifera indica]|uniref:transcription factor bHLH57-like isoform X2 n=1 Tax=Mangifera indica TaxID=29780 RepID=UPI001CFBE9D9|nr:transcription factor bHLH57-like isoform X2 [Mangifera indica]
MFIGFLGEHLNVEGLEQEFLNSEALKFEDEEATYFSMPSSEDKMPFLQMLQSVETPSVFPLKEPNFQSLLGLQHLKKKTWNEINPYVSEMENQIQVLELESCITQELLGLHSPVKSQSETKDLRNPHSTSWLEGASSESNQDQPNSIEVTHPNPQTRSKHTQLSKAPPVTRERRKRKRTKPTKNKEEVESQRMAHIAVERNRRQQMNNHLNTLRSLMPPSFVQKGDQASIIGGAIDFVKELEQLLLSLEAQKRMRMERTTVEGCDSAASSSSTDKANGLLEVSPRIVNEGEVRAENNSSGAKIEVIVIQNHVHLKIQCPRQPGLLLKAIVALEDLKLTFLHLNITSFPTTVLYSFNLKIEDECKLGSSDEIEAAVHQIFSYINGSRLVKWLKKVDFMA